MFMEVIEKNLNDIISPFLRNISHFGLTPTEMHIAGLIKMEGRQRRSPNRFTYPVGPLRFTDTISGRN